MAKTKIDKATELSEPCFFVSQLIGCKAIGTSPDVIRAVLDDKKPYTIAEAKAAINEFLNRKV